MRYDSVCGPLAVWGVLKYFGVRVNARRLPLACHLSRRSGSHTIALAVALREYGLNVTFFSNPDPDPKEIERHCYEKARQLGIPIRKAVSLNYLLSRINEHYLAIVFYDTYPNGGFGSTAHFSPLLGVQDNKLIMPYTDEKLMPRFVFLKGWRASGICRQCILVSDLK